VSIQEPVIEVPFDDDTLFLSQTAFREVIVAELARQIADAIGADPAGGANLYGDCEMAGLRCELRDDPGVRAVLDDLWRRGSLAHLAGCRHDGTRR
jgi:hypothetical protein